MRKLMALVVLLCGAASAYAAEKPDHLLVVMVDSGGGQPQYGEQKVQVSSCDAMATALDEAKAKKIPFTIKPLANPKVAGEVLAAACITPKGGIIFLRGIAPDDSSAKQDAFMKLIGLLHQRAVEFSKKP